MKLCSLLTTHAGDQRTGGNGEDGHNDDNDQDDNDDGHDDTRGAEPAVVVDALVGGGIPAVSTTTEAHLLRGGQSGGHAVPVTGGI